MKNPTIAFIILLTMARFCDTVQPTLEKVPIMSELYPPPKHSAYIWASGDQLYLAFPPLNGSAHGHRVVLPATPAGLSRALAILHDRASALDLRLNQRGTPTQLNLESDKKYNEWLKGHESD